MLPKPGARIQCIETTATTVGYGDVVPINSVGRLVAIGVMLTSIPLFGSLFTLLAAFIVETRIRGVTGIGNFSLLRNHTLCLDTPTIRRRL